MFRNSLIACAVLVSAFQAQAADISVTGIITPGACSMTLGGGGVAAFGTITSATVRTTWDHVTGTDERYVNVADTKTIPFAVSCPTPTKMALSFIDNRRATAVADTTIPGHSSVIFGVGSYGTGTSQISIGGYSINGSELTIKGTAASAAIIPPKRFVTPGVATSSSVFTAASAFEAKGFMPSDKSIAYGLTAAAANPDNITDISGLLRLQLEVRKLVMDTATTDIVLDGSATVTLVIL